MAGAKIDNNIEDVRRVFNVFDKDNDGSLTKAEIRKVLLEAEVQFTDEQLEEFMKKLDRDGDGTVDYEEFCQVMASIITTADDFESRVRAAFDVLDTDGSGTISQSELRQAVLDLGESITQEEADDIISAIDKDGNKEIDYDEFVTLMHLLNLAS